MKKSTIIMIIIDVCAAICFFIFYGPISGFRDYFVTTAKNTMHHGYLARIFYSEKTINRCIDFNPVFNTDTYESIYEEQILKKDPDNDLYKIIEFDGNGYHAYLTVIYDASRVTTTKSEYYGVTGEYLSEMARKSKSIIGINGGAFLDVGGVGNGARAAGVFISNGEILENGYCVVI